MRRDADLERLDAIARGRAAEDGTWSHEAVAGEYQVQVGEGDESVWLSETIHVAAADVMHTVEVHPLRVSGRVTLGDRPIAARVILGGRMRERHKTAVADAEGRYSTVVPLDAGDAWQVDIENDTPPIQRTLEKQKPTPDDDGNLRLDIRLPLTSIAGRVVNEDGAPEAGAIVAVDSDVRRDFQQVFTASDGSFQLVGFPRRGLSRPRRRLPPGKRRRDRPRDRRRRSGG